MNMGITMREIISFYYNNLKKCLYRLKTDHIFNHTTEFSIDFAIKAFECFEDEF